MGWWKLEAWKENSNGETVDLNDADLQHIVESIKKGYTEGEVMDTEK